MSAAPWLQSHRRSILFLLATAALAGALAAWRLPVTLFPNVDFPRVVVSLDAGDRPADQMARAVTQPVEEAVRRVAGVRSVKSTTSRGSAELSVSFDWGLDMAAVTGQVNQALSQVLPLLPAGTQLSTRRMDPTVFPVLAYSLTSAYRSPVELYDLAQYDLRPLLSTVNGVARVQVSGGAQEEIQVSVDPVRLADQGLGLGEVVQALAAGNVLSAAGRVEDHYKLYLSITDGQLHTLADVADTLLKSGPGGTLRLGDVATVARGLAPQFTRVQADGRAAVLLNVYQQPGGNSIAIAREVQARLAAHRAALGADLQIANWYDQSVLITDAAVSVRDAILIGTGLAALVLLVFLRSWSMTVVAMLVVPMVLAATILLLQVLGMSFNIMTLGGMAAAVGLIIDDAIVLIEHIVRRLAEAGAPSRGRVISAALEFTRPLAGSSAATVVIFVPLAFLTGVTGAFFKALSLTMASALLISFLVTWLAVPLLADRLLSGRGAPPGEGLLTRRVHAAYAALMRSLLAYPALLLLALIPLLGAGALAYQRVGSGFMPAMDEGGFILDYRSAPGTSLSETDRLVRQVEAILAANPDVDTYSRRTGSQLGGSLTEANEGDFFIRLKHGQRAPSEQVMDAVRSRVEQSVPGLKIELAQLMEDLIGDLTAVPQPIEIKLFSDQPEQLALAARRVQEVIDAIPGVVDTRDGINPAGDALEVVIDHARAALEGLSADAISQGAAIALGGSVATQLPAGPKLIPVRVWLPERQRRIVPDVARILLRAPDGHLVPLARVAQLSLVSGQPQISRENLKRMVAVTGRISGRSLGAVMGDVRRRIGAPGLLPAGMYVEYGGLYEQQQIAFQGLTAVFASALGLVFLVLLWLYESFRISAVILAMPLLASAAVLVGLWQGGVELNISAMMGMTMIVGIVTEVAIFYFSEFRDLYTTLSFDDALIEAGRNRMRPIAMTTLAAILTLLPLVFGAGQGAAMQQPLAVAIVSGLLVQLPLVLVVMPVFYRIVARR
jgi:CzcA family heavy metal efflux pump